MTDALRNRDPETLTPYEAVLRSFGHISASTQSSTLPREQRWNTQSNSPPIARIAGRISHGCTGGIHTRLQFAARSFGAGAGGVAACP